MSSEPLLPYRAVYLTAEDLRSAASLLYNAYLDEPLFKSSLNYVDESHYQQKLRASIREELNQLWLEEQTLIGLFEGSRLVGVVSIVMPQLIGDARFWHWRLKMLLAAGWKSTQALIAKEQSILEHLPEKNCAIVQFVAVAPTEQHKGIGGRLLTVVKSWCDEQPNIDGIGVFVSDNNHVTLFQQQGFGFISEITIGDVAGGLYHYVSNSFN